MRTLLACAALLCALSLPAHAERRAALLLGENSGDRTDPALRYAQADAERVRDVLVQLGGVAEADALLLRGATAGELRTWLGRLGERLHREGWGPQDRLLVYVSAHASGGELHLRGTRFPVAELQQFLAAAPVGVTVLVLDTCEAGAGLRAKGVLVLSGAAQTAQRQQLSGRVVIASAGADEAAFESDELRGSLFTHHFVAGLRGAADSSRDGRVTLQEAYAYAYTRTADASLAVKDAQQTPNFDIRLSGEGELVLSELGRGRARLTLDLDEPGDWSIASIDGAGEVARFVKSPGRAELALEPGTFRLRSRARDHFLEETVTLTEGGHVTVTAADLSSWKVAPGGRKGLGEETSLAGFALFTSAAVSGLPLLTGGGLALVHALDAVPGWGRPVWSVALSQSVGTERAQGVVERELSLEAGGGWELPGSLFHLRALLRAGAVLIHQSDPLGHKPYGLQPRVDAEGQLALPLAFRLRVTASISGGAVLVATETGRLLRPVVAATGGLEWAF